MKARIYHHKTPTFFQDSSEEGLEATRNSLYSDEFTWVASVEIEEGDLEDAYMLTQNMTTGWFDKDTVVMRNSTLKGARSTSVGDVIAIDGEFHVVGGIGFFKLY
jgi:hypothetical protein